MPIKLTNSEANLFLTEHIPYRLNQLMGYQYYRAVLCKGLTREQQLLVGPSIVEGSAIAGRQLCIVLGITHSASGLTANVKWHAQDVNLESFDLPLVSPTTIPINDQQILETFLFQANKSTAHLTHSAPMDGWACLPRATEVIKELLEHHLYRPLKTSMTRWSPL